MTLFHKTFNGIKDPLIISDLFSETIGGGSNTVCALGNNRLTVGISPWAEIVYLRWPDLSKYDHLRYITKHRHILHGLIKVKDMRYGSDAPCADWHKYGRPYEKYPGLGACGGLFSRDCGMVWQDQPCWTSTRAYNPEWSHLLETKLVTDALSGLPPAQIKISQWVMPESDLLVQHYSIDAPAYESFFYHGVFAPWMKNPGGLHNPDQKRAGFGAIYMEQENIFLWMSPHKNDRKILKKNFTTVKSIRDLENICRGRGIFIAMACSGPVSQYQAGADTTGRIFIKQQPTAGRGRPFEYEQSPARFRRLCSKDSPCAGQR